jgi:hypothetical protein
MNTTGAVEALSKNNAANTTFSTLPQILKLAMGKSSFLYWEPLFWVVMLIPLVHTLKKISER